MTPADRPIIHSIARILVSLSRAFAWKADFPIDLIEIYGIRTNSNLGGYMKNKKLRNIGIIAHVDAGKTTTTERILFYAGENHRVGEVHEGNTTMDFDPQERKRGITINSAATTVHWRECQINVIDTPGHIDFNVEVNRSLRVLDGAVVLFDAVAGVEPQTETNWRLADKYGVPRLCFVNKLDRIGADFYRVVDMIGDRLDVTPLVLQLPIGSESHFRGVVDLLTMQAVVWPSDEAGVAFRIEAIPEELVQAAATYRAKLVEAVVEQDESVMPAARRAQACCGHAYARVRSTAPLCRCLPVPHSRTRAWNCCLMR